MRILLAPDSFKGSISNREFCEIGKKAILDVDENIQVDMFPLADGGENTLDLLSFYLGAKIFHYKIFNPYFEKIDVKVAKKDDLAIIESATICGLPLVADRENPLKTSTYGIGNLILQLKEENIKEFIISLGGSSTNDAGCGMLAALGLKFVNHNNDEFVPTGGNIQDIQIMDPKNLFKNIEGLNFTILADVENPLYGENGATYVFAKQKGARDEDLPLLEDNLRLFDVITKCTFFGKKDYGKAFGAGAAGGLGYAFLSYLDGNMKSGIEYIMELSRIEESIKKADLIITGEGKFDHQSYQGKVISGIAKLGRKYHKPIVVVCGISDTTFLDMKKYGITSVFSMINKPSTLEESLFNTRENLAFTIKNITNIFKNTL